MSRSSFGVRSKGRCADEFGAGSMSAARRKTVTVAADPVEDRNVGAGTRALSAPLGQGDDFHRWVALAAKQQLHHGVLVGGAAGTGKTHAVWHIAAALLCEDPEDGPCGVCRSCAQLAQNNHADVSLLDLPEGKADIPLESVRNILEELPLSSHGGRGRVLIVDPADRLNEQGQNALLKTLEEPAPKTWILLAASRSGALLPTVQSRVLSVRMRPLRDPVDFSRVCAEIAPELGTPDAARQARSGGSVGRYLELSDEVAQKAEHLVAEVAAGTHRLGPLGLAKAALQGAEGRQGGVARARSVLGLLATRCREGYQHAVAGGDWASYGAAALEPWLTRSEALLAAEADLAQQIPPEQVLAGVFLDWTAVASP